VIEVLKYLRPISAHPVNSTFALNSITNRVPDQISMVTRLGCSTSFRSVVQGYRDAFNTISASGEGQALLKSWDMGTDEIGSMKERLIEMEEDFMSDDEDDML
jgi:hypothetical protein